MTTSQSKKQRKLELSLINAAIELASRHRWRDISIRDIAIKAGISTAEALNLFPSKHSILEGFDKSINQVVLEGLLIDPETGDSKKDRLFDILMRRFEAMSDYKNGLAAIGVDIGCDPCTALRSLSSLYSSMALTLEAAHISTSGPGGKLRIHGLMIIYTYCLRVWFRDENKDLSSTMAAVDRGVSFAEKLVSMAPFKKNHLSSAIEPDHS